MSSLTPPTRRHFVLHQIADVISFMFLLVSMLVKANDMENNKSRRRSNNSLDIKAQRRRRRREKKVKAHKLENERHTSYRSHTSSGSCRTFSLLKFASLGNNLCPNQMTAGVEDEVISSGGGVKSHMKSLAAICGWRFKCLAYVRQKDENRLTDLK